MRGFAMAFVCICIRSATIKSGCKTCGPHGTYGRVAEQEDTYCEGFGSLLKCACRLVEGSMRKVQVLSSNVRSYLNIFQLITIHLNRLRTTFLFCSYNLHSTYDAAQEFIQEGFITYVTHVRYVLSSVWKFRISRLVM